MADLTRPEQREQFAVTSAEHLAGAVDGPTTRWQPAHALSNRFVFYADDNRPLVVCGSHEPQREVGWRWPTALP